MNRRIMTEALAGIKKLKADGSASQLGDGVKAVLKSFRGGSLAAAIVMTDGQITAGEGLTQAAREAARSGIPLYFVGFGDPVTNPDLSLTDLRADDVVMKGDQLVFEARLTAIGPPPPPTVPVVLSEMKNGKPVELSRVSVRTDPSGKPVPFRLTHTPTEAGEKTYIIETPSIPGETDVTNNRIERVVIVTETKRLRVLFIDGYPRYEFRFVKDQLERESDAIKGNKSIELSTLQLSAAKEYALQDKSALRSIPTRDELFQYDVVLIGDVDPKQFPHPDQTMQDLADFVKIKGGGLLVIAGEQSVPQKFFDTPLGDILPILPAGSPRPTQEDMPITEGYRPRLTAVGQSHPLFRFAADEAQNAAVWSGLKPLYWYATGYKRKLSAEVLAVHPEKTAVENVTESYPLVLQQFAGAGRVVFFGFDETWRWRFRDGEEKFNQFWTQVVRVLGRNRVHRVELRTDRQTPYRQSEPIKITVRFPDDAPAPDANTAVRVVADRTPPKGTSGELDSQTIQLVKVEGTRATYEGVIVRTPPGDYRFRVVSPEQPGNPPRAEAKVLPPPGEGERLDMNVAEMTRAARESRGQFFTLAEADKVIDSLPEAERVPLNQPCPPIPLWSHWGSFLILVSLFATEWWYRRRERLV
ncbi:MAG: VWA domain-containing protein [Gemmataceae bacterium]